MPEDYWIAIVDRGDGQDVSKIRVTEGRNLLALKRALFDGEQAQGVVQVIDQHLQDYVTVNDDFQDIVKLFRSRRLRIRIISDKLFSNTHDSNRDAQPLALPGRFFQFSSPYRVGNTKVSLEIREHSNQPSLGTGSTIWDGALLLAKYLEHFPHCVQNQYVLELGAGCGLVGLVAGVLGAASLTLTDMSHIIPLLQDNLHNNRNALLCRDARCIAYDWYQPHPPPTDNTTVILIADCVWTYDLVAPLLSALKAVIQENKSNNPTVLISYQRRGKDTHEAFGQGLREILDVTEIDTKALGYIPDALHLYHCKPK